MADGKFIGIDYGTKHVGIALSDETGTLAFPKFVFPNNNKLLFAITEFCKEENIKGIVLGESEDLDGTPNPIMKKINVFSERLKEGTGLPIYFEKEFWSSAEARKTPGRTEMTDASAAAIILQRYLDKNKNGN